MVAGREVVDLHDGYRGAWRGRHTGDSARSRYRPDPSRGDRNEGGKDDIYVVPFPNTRGGKWPVSTDGGTEPVWSHRGTELFYRDASGNLVAVGVNANRTFSVGRSRVLFPAAGYASLRFTPQYAVARDDRRFLMVRSLETNTPDKLIVVENWFEELKAKSRK